MSDTEHSVTLKSYVRLCACVFLAIICATAAMIYASFLPHYGWPAKVTFILIIATVNASLIAGFLMHLFSEKKLVFTVLAFTAFFFAGLIGLTMWAMNDFPPTTAIH
jgi:heme/copper-type cytochrome/quinol oxidase subunit 4